MNHLIGKENSAVKANLCINTAVLGKPQRFSENITEKKQIKQ